MTANMQRIPSLPRERWTDEARDVFAFWGEPNAREEGSRTSIMMVLAQHPAMALPYCQWSKHLLMTNTLPVRSLEMLILRVSVRVKSHYEWHNHVGYGLKAGLTLEDIAAIRDFPETADHWTVEERAVLQAVDDLIDDHHVSDEVWQKLGDHYDTRQKMDLVMSIGHYVMTSWAISSFGVPIEGDVDPIGFDLKTVSGKVPGASLKPGESADWAKQYES